MILAKLQTFGIKLEKGFGSLFNDKMKSGQSAVDSVVYVAVCVCYSIFPFSY